MIDWTGIGTMLTGTATLITALRIHRKVETGNGKTIGHQIADLHADADDVPREPS